MLWNLIFGLAAGVLTPVMEPHLRRALNNIAGRELSFKPSEFSILTALIMLVGAALLVAVIGANSMAVPLLVGAGLGLFHRQIIDLIPSGGKTAANPGTGTRYTAPPTDAPRAAAGDADGETNGNGTDRPQG